MSAFASSFLSRSSSFLVAGVMVVVTRYFSAEMGICLLAARRQKIVECVRIFPLDCTATGPPSMLHLFQPPSQFKNRFRDFRVMRVVVFPRQRVNLCSISWRVKGTAYHCKFAASVITNERFFSVLIWIDCFFRNSSAPSRA